MEPWIRTHLVLLASRVQVVELSVNWREVTWETMKFSETWRQNGRTSVGKAINAIKSARRSIIGFDRPVSHTGWPRHNAMQTLRLSEGTVAGYSRFHTTWKKNNVNSFLLWMDRIVANFHQSVFQYRQVSIQKSSIQTGFNTDRLQWVQTDFNRYRQV